MTFILPATIVKFTEGTLRDPVFLGVRWSRFFGLALAHDHRLEKVALASLASLALSMKEINMSY